jgi:hypothetical protein
LSTSALNLRIAHFWVSLSEQLPQQAAQMAAALPEIQQQKLADCPKYVAASA